MAPEPRRRGNRLPPRANRSASRRAGSLKASDAPGDPRCCLERPEAPEPACLTAGDDVRPAGAQIGLYVHRIHLLSISLGSASGSGLAAANDVHPNTGVEMALHGHRVSPPFDPAR